MNCALRSMLLNQDKTLSNEFNLIYSYYLFTYFACYSIAPARARRRAHSVWAKRTTERAREDTLQQYVAVINLQGSSNTGVAQHSLQHSLARARSFSSLKRIPGARASNHTAASQCTTRLPATQHPAWAATNSLAEHNATQLYSISNIHYQSYSTFIAAIKYFYKKQICGMKNINKNRARL